MAQAKLRDGDRRVYQRLIRAASRGDPCPSNRDLLGLLETSDLSSATKALRRIERAGLIQVDSYSTLRRVTITRTGQSTRPVTGQALHYRVKRSRPPTSGPAPALPINRVADDYGAATGHAIQREAVKLGVSISDFLSRLTGIGWREYVSAQAA